MVKEEESTAASWRARRASAGAGAPESALTRPLVGLASDTPFEGLALYELAFISRRIMSPFEVADSDTGVEATEAKGGAEGGASRRVESGASGEADDANGADVNIGHSGVHAPMYTLELAGRSITAEGCAVLARGISGSSLLASLDLQSNPLEQMEQDFEYEVEAQGPPKTSASLASLSAASGRASVTSLASMASFTSAPGASLSGASGASGASGSEGSEGTVDSFSAALGLWPTPALGAGGRAYPLQFAPAEELVEKKGPKAPEPPPGLSALWRALRGSRSLLRLNGLALDGRTEFEPGRTLRFYEVIAGLGSMVRRNFLTGMYSSGAMDRR